MSTFWFIRHGESESNAGLPSITDQSTPLTEKGFTQAELVASSIKKAPDRFVVSPYLRTQQTAAPTLEKHPNVPVETWLVQEYSYLSHQQYYNTTPDSRRKLSEKYFLTADPDLILGEGGESFNQFIDRVKSSLKRLKNATHYHTIIFGHGWFMRAILWVMYQEKESRQEKKRYISQLRSITVSSPWLIRLWVWMDNRKWIKKMFSFLIFSAAIQTPNCSILKFAVTQDEVNLVGYDVSHLPNELRGTTLINR